MSTASDTAIGAVSGAAQGAVVAGPAGAVVGAILGGISGLFKGKSRKAAKKANAVKQQMDDVQNATIRRNELRAAFITRQTALAAGAVESGGLQSSTVQGAVGGIGSQLAYNERYFDTQLANINTFNRYSKKAEKYADYAQAAATLGEAGTTIAKYRGSFSFSGKAPGTPAGGTSPSILEQARRTGHVNHATGNA